MLALAGIGLIAAPIERDVEPSKQVAVIKASKVARTAMAQHITRLGVLAQIDREIEALGHEALAQCCPILRGQFNFAERRAGMEEIELNRLGYTRLQRPDRF